VITYLLTVLSLNQGATRLHYVAGLPYLPVPTLLGATVAYGPVALALLLCWLGGDRLSWRYVQHPVSNHDASISEATRRRVGVHVRREKSWCTSQPVSIVSIQVAISTRAHPRPLWLLRCGGLARVHAPRIPRHQVGLRRVVADAHVHARFFETVRRCAPEMPGAAGPDGVQRLAEGLGAGALPAVTMLSLYSMHVGDAGASELAAALGRGALPRLKRLVLDDAAIGNAGLVALAPALQRLPALERLYLTESPFGDEGLAALVAPPPTAGAPPPTAGGLAKLEELWLGGVRTQITDAGCAAIAAALDSGALPALELLHLHGTPASAAAQAAVHAALVSCIESRRA
jgi:hypothetical protein